MTLAKVSSYLWSPVRQRCLAGPESMLAQGFVTYGNIGSLLNRPTLLGTDNASRTSMAHRPGNAMHVGAVGLVLLWIAVYGEGVHHDVPRAVHGGTMVSEASFDDGLGVQGQSFFLRRSIAFVGTFSSRQPAVVEVRFRTSSRTTGQRGGGNDCSRSG